MIRLPFDISVTLSKKKKIPVFYMFGRTFLPHQLLRFLASARWAKIIGKNRESVVIELYGQRIWLLNNFFIIFVNEWRIWEKYYLPTFSLKGKTVLDVGAGCGETAFFYLLHGTQKIVAIEPDREAIACLRENASRNGWNVEIIPEAFKLNHLDIPHDFMKMDIEGQEKELLQTSNITPCIIEVHSKDLEEKLEEKGFKEVCSYKGYYLMTFSPKPRSSAGVN